MNLYLSQQHGPHLNLAMEAELLREGREACYLWVNSPCVVIGRNQNPYRECDLAYMRRVGVSLARRMTGGGTVYHDLGNLNYSFVAPSERDDLVRDVVGSCLERVGIRATFSGRNDIEVAGRKVGGMAWYQDEAWLSHGTLLVETDLGEMEAALRPSPLKLRSKGIDSVRARVSNLSEHCPNLTVSGIIDAFSQTLGSKPLPIGPSRRAAAEAQRLAGYTWLFGQTPAFDVSHELRLPNGIYQVDLQIENGGVANATVNTDSLDPLAADSMRASLLGKHYETLLENWQAARESKEE